jgi:hypothetical protein
MHVHSPNLLQGPISRRRIWWNISDDDIMEAMSKLPPCQDVPIQKNVGKKPRSDDAPIRKGLVERVRREIAAGTYDTPEKWEAALDRLSKRLEERGSKMED